MRQRGGRRDQARVRLVVTALVALGLGAVALPAVAAPPTPPGPPDGHGGRLLDEPARGVRALELLGDRLPDAARRSGLGTSELRQLLQQDRAAWVDAHGQVFYTDRLEGSDEPTRAEAAPFPYADTFSLHSRPSAARTIYLDFDGQVVSNSAWNPQGISATAKQPAFDLDGDSATFSEPERDVIQSVWQRVAEDFAPFDVDVTTADPGAAGLRRSSSADDVYGVRALITPSVQAADVLCSSFCSGTAYIGTFDEVLATGDRDHQPAWIFSHIAQGPKGIAETVSHEVGHNLGLQHDGPDYYPGHGAWGPIMGAAFEKPIVQWSKGEYVGADNTQADLTVMNNNGAPTRLDDHGNSTATARALGAGTTPTATGVISAPGDKDYFSITRVCPGALTVQARPAPVSPNLDIQVRVFDSTGALLGTDNPLSAAVDGDTASGLDAQLTRSVAAGTYYVEVDGVGALNPANTGYSDYGSLGAYTVSATGCGAPAAPTSVTTTKNLAGGSATLAWQPPANDGGYPVSSYVVTRDGQPVATLASSARSHTFGGLTAGATYALGVAAVNEEGIGAAAVRSVTMVSVPPSRPRELTGYDMPSVGGSTVYLSWEPPDEPGDSAVTGYVVERVGGGASTPVNLPASETEYWAEDLALGTPYTFKVSAVSSAGKGEAATYSTTLRIPRDPSPPQNVVATPGDRSASVSWMPPLDPGSSPINRYQVLVYWNDGSTVIKSVQLPVTATTTYPMKTTVGGLFNGDSYALAVTAFNDEGYSDEVLSNFVKPRAAGATAPGAPRIGKAVAGAAGGKITAKAVWAAPLSNGGKAITGYKVSAHRMSAAGAVLATTVSGLRPATARSFVMTLPRKGQYRFSVRAVNSVGTGPASAKSNKVAGR